MPTQSKDPHGTRLGPKLAVSTLNRLADVCNSVSILIPGLKEAVNVAMRVVKVAQVSHSAVLDSNHINHLFRIVCRRYR